MNVTCRNCEATIKVPDNKIPKGQSFSFKCPSCKDKVVVPDGIKTGGVEQSLPAIEQELPLSEQNLFDTARFETGTLLHGAMACHAEPKKVLSITDMLGFVAHSPGTHAEALGRLRYNEYGLIIVTEEFEELSHDGASLLEAVKQLTMQKRRKLFLVYIAGNVKSFDRMEAAAHSVNLIISADDLDKKEKIADAIKRGMADHQLDYKIYNESLSSIRSI